ncbi:integrase catalytic domain-containing protein [Trichonephila clavipes]|uniref:Integrase catalytic domain-containing protein n=1 Tax=Trichonephila clavipes TaxID=2585209 RepID=A0A8X6RQY6_TRICX|nr:integrase catalytic domain-containing protein [Trichonephila clavipes]
MVRENTGARSEGATCVWTAANEAAGFTRVCYRQSSAIWGCQKHFPGANNWINALDWDRNVDAASVLRIQWKFNPPTAAWWGGFWESLIQMVKKLLRRVLEKASLYYEEIFTILCDIEATINSRPLNY